MDRLEADKSKTRIAIFCIAKLMGELKQVKAVFHTLYIILSFRYSENLSYGKKFSRLTLKNLKEYLTQILDYLEKKLKILFKNKIAKRLLGKIRHRKNVRTSGS